MRLIDADALLKKLNDNSIEYDAYVNHFILNAPTVYAMPVIYAHWKDDGFDYGYHDFSQCTACGWKNPYAIVPWFKFCSNCGAKMDEEENG